MKRWLAAMLAALVFGICYLLLVARAPSANRIAWGIDFSKTQAQALGLDWKQAYLAMLDDLKVRHVKLLVDWSSVEPSAGTFSFADADWQVRQAKSRGAAVMYVLGVKTGRWPECHIPAWAAGLPAQQQREAALAEVAATVNHFKDNPAIAYWQAENEPLFPFGRCPSWYYDGGAFLKRETALIRQLDPSRPVVVSDSGNLSLWGGASSIGDVLGITLYEKYWVPLTNAAGFYMTFPLSPASYALRAAVTQAVFHKPIFCVELQAEPWNTKPFSAGVPLQEQFKSMNAQQFMDNVRYAEGTGLDTFYFWGAEWWYWLKEKQNQPQIWNEAKAIMATSS